MRIKLPITWVSLCKHIAPHRSDLGRESQSPSHGGITKPLLIASCGLARAQSHPFYPLSPCAFYNIGISQLCHHPQRRLIRHYLSAEWTCDTFWSYREKKNAALINCQIFYQCSHCCDLTGIGFALVRTCVNLRINFSADFGQVKQSLQRIVWG